MKKTTKGEGKIEVLRGEEAQVLNDHFAKTGKYAVSDFNEEEREALDQSLNEVKAKENTPPVETRTEEPTGGDDE